jgi:hypothetical protein
MGIGKVLRAAFWPGVMVSMAIVIAQQAGWASATEPWAHDVAVMTLDSGGVTRTIATFPRAGVSTLARQPGGRVVVAYQYFPEGRAHADFDRIAVRVSDDEGDTWSEPKAMVFVGLPDGLRTPFDPTLVTLPDGRLRLYFTSMPWPAPTRGRSAAGGAIYSATSVDGYHYTVEPGVRFAVEHRAVVDSAVVLHRGQFHLFAPDGGTDEAPGPAYHAVSPDGLVFTRAADVSLPDRRWLGSASSDGELLRFFGTGAQGTVWTATSPDGETWTPETTITPAGADPGVVPRRVAGESGAWLISVTTAPRPAASPIR